MKKNYTLCILLFALFSFVLPLTVVSEAQAMSSISAEDAAKEIVGKWKLLSYTDRHGKTTSYEHDNKVWTFTGNSLSVESDDLGGRREGSYRLERSRFRVSNTVIILCDALEETHLSYGKFVVISIENNTLNLTNWEDDIKYTLQRVE